MRKFLLNGTDLKGSLINITTTQGRLNAYNAILESSKFCYNTSINEHPSRANSLIRKIYPNPVKDELFVELNNYQNTSLEIKIYSIFGKELLSLANRDYNQYLDLDLLSSGYYILSVFNPDNNQFEQVGFVKQ
ncbi:MAG: T9SS type A sorting domain-containing protein [Bacteroidetes bacterium]|nr:T9SS type A sorting domain-containing protein [Bacteroidota bacterium]